MSIPFKRNSNTILAEYQILYTHIIPYAISNYHNFNIPDYTEF